VLGKRNREDCRGGLHRENGSRSDDRSRADEEIRGDGRRRDDGRRGDDDRHRSDSRRGDVGDNHDDHKGINSEKRYGLISTSRVTTSSSSTNITSTTAMSSNSSKGGSEYLGPNPKLLQLKLEKEQQEKLSRLNQLKKQQGISVKQMSEDERKQRLTEMETDAVLNDNLRQHRHSNVSSNHHSDASISLNMKGNDDKDNDPYTGNAKFLQSMRKEVYSSASTMDVSARIDQNKHYRQSSVDIDSSDGFLKR
jgi:hypothetical protein